MLFVAGTVLSAPVPDHDDLSASKLSTSYDGGPIPGPNPSGTANNQCPSGGAAVETFTLRTVSLTVTFAGNHSLQFLLSPVQSADMILTIRDGSGAHLQSSDNGSVNGGEAVTLQAAAGTTTYKVLVCSFAGSAASYHVDIQLADILSTGGGDPGPCDAPLFGAADPLCAGNPRYQLLVPPDSAGWSNSGSGEYNIGFNPHSKRIMGKNTFPNSRTTPAEYKNDGSGDPSGLPEACPETWEDMTNVAEAAGLDPILWTDPVSGRSFESNSTAGAQGDFAWSDDDGATWVPVSIAVPNGGVDHQSIGSGPIPASLSALATPQNQGQFVAYCSQDLIGANCQRSLTLGNSFENTSVPATGPGTNNSQGCGGLHGHLRGSPDGTMYIPDRSCGGLQGGAFTLDTSTTPWTEFSVPNTATDGEASDPSIGIDADNTIYFCYTNSEAGGTERHAHVAVGRRSGSAITWLRDFDIGRSHNVRNAVFPEAIGGSSGRAACGFIGTNQPGTFQNPGFPGDWYAFIATTYDQGRTWTTVNVTPNDPVQHKEGVCMQGTGCGGGTSQRNLLDFNEMTVDDKGRPIYGYSDGCVTPGCVSRAQGNDNVAFMRSVRQIGGRTLLASQDVNQDTNDGVDGVGPINPKTVAPKAPCLLDASKGHPNASSRDSTTAHLAWRTPDSGGAPIENYSIYRSTTPGNASPTLLATTADAKTTYDDPTAGNTQFLYYTIKANTATPQTSVASNEVKLEIGAGSGTPCVEPGIIVDNDLLADFSDDDSGQNIPPVPSVNIKSLSISEPFMGAGNKLVFTLQVGPDVAASPNSEWYIIWNRKNGDTAADGSDRKYIGMLTNAQGAPYFEYGDWGPPIPIPGVPPPNANTPTPLAELPDGCCTYDFATGKIRMVIDNATVAEGVAAGNSMTAVNVRTFAGRYSGDPTAPRGQKSQNNSSDITVDGVYNLVGNLFCRGNKAPIIDTFTVTPASGITPLTVKFNATGHDDDTDAPADTITTWHVDFGDGSPAVDLSSPPTNLSHIYTTSASDVGYTASLSVTDSRGKQSLSTKLTEVEVRQTPANLPPWAVASDSMVDEGVTATLDGSHSADPEGGTLTYQWSQLNNGGPAVTVVPVPGTPSNATFDAPFVLNNTPLAFRLVVTDPQGASNLKDITVTVKHVVPSSGGAPPSENLQLGGALSWVALLPLGLAGLARRAPKVDRGVRR